SAKNVSARPALSTGAAMPCPTTRAQPYSRVSLPTTESRRNHASPRVTDGRCRALSFILVAAANSAAQGARPYVCMTRDFTKRVAYVSRVFNVQQADAPKVNPAWNQVMTSTYGITALPYQSCQGPYPSVALADS